MVDHGKLSKALPSHAKLVIGDVEKTVPDFLKEVSEESPIGFIAIDVDYYRSAKQCLKILQDGNPNKYLPMTLIYLDDIGTLSSNPWVGELLAVNEFNAENEHRKIHPYTFLRTQRIFKQTRWIDQIFVMHTLDHEWRSVKNQSKKVIADNPYLSICSYISTEPQINRYFNFVHPLKSKGFWGIKKRVPS